MQLESDRELDYIGNAASQSPTINSITGTIGKAFDTFVDALAVQGAGKLVGTVYPTGQQDPAAVKAQNTAAANTQAAAAFDPKPYLVYGGIAIVGIVGLLVVVKALNSK